MNMKVLVPTIVIVALLAIGVGFALNRSPEPQPTPGPSPSPAPTPTPESVTVPEIPADWQTYRNDEFGFEVRYPQQYIDAEGRDCAVEQAFDPAYSLTNGFFTITSLENSSGVALNEFARISEEERWVDEVQIAILEPYTINEFEFVSTFHAYQEGRNQHTVAIYVANNSKVLRFWYEAWPAAPCWGGIIQQVLETIRF